MYKSPLITFADTEEIIVNDEALIGRSPKVFTAEVVQAVEELACVHGHSSNRAIGKLSGAMRRALSRFALKAEGQLSASVTIAYRNKDKGTVELIKQKIEALADWKEAFYAEYAAHADVLAALSDYDVHFHPFQKRQLVTYAVDNSIDAEELEEDVVNGWEDDFADDEAAAWLAEQDTRHMMEQSDLREHKVSTVAAMDAEPKYEIINITREEWIEEMLERSTEEWAQSASYAAWDRIGLILEKFKDSPDFALFEEDMQSYLSPSERANAPAVLSEKKLAASSKILRKAIDYKLRVEALEQRQQYELDRMHKMDNSPEELTIAAMSNSARESDLAEIEIELRDAMRIADFLAEASEQLTQWLDLVNLDNPYRKYSTYMAFDPVDFLTGQMVKRAGYIGESAAFNRTRYQKGALKMLGNPASIESFKLNDEDPDSLELWGVHFTHGSDSEVLEAARKLRKVRAIRYRHDDLAAREIKLQKIVKGNAMRNKKPTSMADIEATISKFSF